MFNFRGWLPFEISRNSKIRELGEQKRIDQNKLESDNTPGGDDFFAEADEFISGYQYVIITKEKETADKTEDPLEANIVYNQLIQIQ